MAGRPAAVITSMGSLEFSPQTRKFTNGEQPADAFVLLNEFRQSGFLTDVVIEVDGRKFSAHRAVLAASVPYFRSMFASNMREATQREVAIQDISAPAFESLLQYAYTAAVDIGSANVQQLLYAASILQMDDVCAACENFLTNYLTPHNCLQLRHFAQLHNCAALVTSIDAFTCDNFPEVHRSADFNEIAFEHLRDLVASDELRVGSETEVVDALLAWVGAQPAERRPRLGDLLQHVRLAQLPVPYLVNEVNMNQMIKEDGRCRELVLSAMAEKVCQKAGCERPVASQTPAAAAQGSPAVTRPRKATAGVVFCVGGRGTTGDPFRSVEAYDWRRDKWFTVAEMTVRRRHVGVVSARGKLYAIGGHDGQNHLDSAECFDPPRAAWFAVASMQQRRRGIAVGALCGAIYAVGGLDDTTCFHTVERYDIVGDEWSSVATMNVQRGGVGVAALGQCLYAIGGNDGTSSLDSCERYDPHVNKWHLVAPMAHRRAGSGVTMLDNCLYAIGGFDDNAPLATCERYDPVADQWHMLPPMSCPRGGVGVASLGGRVYAVGGHDGKAYLDSVEAFDPLTDSWAPVTPIGQCRAGAGVAWCDTSVDVLTSRGATGFSPSASSSSAAGAGAAAAPPANSGGGVAYCV